MELAVLTQDPNPLDVTTLMCANPFLAAFISSGYNTTDKPTIASSFRPREKRTTRADSPPNLARVHDPKMC